MIKKQVNILIFCLTCILLLPFKTSCGEVQTNHDLPYMLENQLPVGVPDSGVIRNLRTLVETEPEAGELWRQLQRRAESYLSEKPRPVENIHYEGMLSNHPVRLLSLSRTHLERRNTANL